MGVVEVTDFVVDRLSEREVRGVGYELVTGTAVAGRDKSRICGFGLSARTRR